MQNGLYGFYPLIIYLMKPILMIIYICTGGILKTALKNNYLKFCVQVLNSQLLMCSQKGFIKDFCCKNYILF